MSIESARAASEEYEAVRQHLPMSDLFLMSSAKAWRGLLEVTSEKSGSKPARNHRLRYTFRSGMQCFLLLFFSVLIACIAVKAFQDLVKERVEMRERDFSHMALLHLPLPVD